MLRNMTAIYIINNDKVLLLYRIGSKVFDHPLWCGIGGHFEKDELNDPKTCVLRELYEEAKIRESDIDDIKLKYMTLRYKNNEIRQNYYYFANLKNNNIDIQCCNEGKLEWLSIDDAIKKDMPFSAKYCFEHYFNTGKNNDVIYAGVTTEHGINFIELEDF